MYTLIVNIIFVRLELRMEHLGYSNFKDHDDNLRLEKAKIPQVLEDIMNFNQLGLGLTLLSTIFHIPGGISWRSVLLMEETGVPVENH
jgi:hypothetical protein